MWHVGHRDGIQKWKLRSLFDKKINEKTKKKTKKFLSETYGMNSHTWHLFHLFFKLCFYLLSDLIHTHLKELVWRRNPLCNVVMHVMTSPNTNPGAFVLFCFSDSLFQCGYNFFFFRPWQKLNTEIN